MRIKSGSLKNKNQISRLILNQLTSFFPFKNGFKIWGFFYSKENILFYKDARIYFVLYDSYIKVLLLKIIYTCTGFLAQP